LREREDNNRRELETE